MYKWLPCAWNYMKSRMLHTYPGLNKCAVSWYFKHALTSQSRTVNFPFSEKLDDWTTLPRFSDEEHSFLSFVFHGWYSQHLSRFQRCPTLLELHTRRKHFFHGLMYQPQKKNITVNIQGNTIMYTKRTPRCSHKINFLHKLSVWQEINYY